MPRKITITPEVRRLLGELDELFDRSLALTSQLTPNSGVSFHDAINIGAEREHVRALIRACAWRINKASTGRE